MSATSLPVSTDVVVNITTPLVATATDMSVGCILTNDAAPSSWAVGQVLGYYGDFAAFAEDFTSASPIYTAAEAFFGQSPRPSKLAVGLVTGTTLELSKAVGSFAFTANPTDGDTITIGTQTYRFKTTPAQVGDVFLNATTLATTLGHLVATINGTGVAGTDFYAGTPHLSALVTAGGTSPHVTITAVPSFTAGILVLSSAEANAVATAMALPANQSISDYATSVQAAATGAGGYLFAWGLSSTFRDVNSQKALADWCQANDLACFLVTNSADALNPALSTDIGSVLKLATETSACVFYHDTATEYPEMGAMALMLAVDYSGVNTTLTLKFKALSGITSASITETQYMTLNGKNYNMVTLTGNQVVFIREGKNAAASWWTDQYCGIQNFRNEIQYAVFNVLLAKKKVPYTVEGQLMLKQACTTICQRYVNNGFLASRPSTDDEGKDTVLPAFAVTPGNLALATASQRASRVAPPIAITAYLAGAIHTVTLNIDMVP